MKTFSFDLITPEGTLISDQVQDLVAMTESGEVGILFDHASLKSKLKSAPIKYTSEDGTKDLVAVLGGILEVENNKVTVLTDFAEKGKDIDETEANNAAEKAKAEIQLLSPDAQIQDRDLVIAEAKLQRELLRLQTARLKKKL